MLTSADNTEPDKDSNHYEALQEDNERINAEEGKAKSIA